MTLFHFNVSDTTTWIATREESCVARFGPRLFEIAGVQYQAYKSTDQAEAWATFTSSLESHFGIVLDDFHMPQKLWLAMNPGRKIETQGVFEISIPELSIKRNPFVENPWCAGAITIDEISKCIEKGDFAHEPVEMENLHDQIKRIAYLATTPAEWDPIDISVTTTTGDIEINDGHHRTAAAIYLELPTIHAIFDGYVSKTHNPAFPSAIRIS